VTYSVWSGSVVAARPCWTLLWCSTYKCTGWAFSAASNVSSSGSWTTVARQDDASQCGSVYRRMILQGCWTISLSVGLFFKNKSLSRRRGKDNIVVKTLLFVAIERFCWISINVIIF
jgi:hypothetical protein